VRRIYEALVHEQKSIGEIVRMLNAEHVPTRRGAPRWDRATVWGVLSNPAYRGEAAFGKTEAVERGRLLRPIRGKAAISRRSKSSYRDKPPEQWIHIRVPVIVSAEIFAAAHDQLQRNRRLSQRNARGARYLLQLDRGDSVLEALGAGARRHVVILDCDASTQATITVSSSPPAGRGGEPARSDSGSTTLTLPCGTRPRPIRCGCAVGDPSSRRRLGRPGATAPAGPAAAPPVPQYARRSRSRTTRCEPALVHLRPLRRAW
jgi:hypothetical protein